MRYLEDRCLGRSCSGRHVLYLAVHDRRIKAVFSQVGGMESQVVVTNEEQAAKTLDEATSRTRGLPMPHIVHLTTLQSLWHV